MPNDGHTGGPATLRRMASCEAQQQTAAEEVDEARPVGGSVEGHGHDAAVAGENGSRRLGRRDSIARLRRPHRQHQATARRPSVVHHSILRRRRSLQVDGDAVGAGGLIRQQQCHRPSLPLLQLRRRIRPAHLRRDERGSRGIREDLRGDRIRFRLRRVRPQPRHVDRRHQPASRLVVYRHRESVQQLPTRTRLRCQQAHVDGLAAARANAQLGGQHVLERQGRSAERDGRAVHAVGRGRSEPRHGHRGPPAGRQRREALAGHVVEGERPRDVAPWPNESGAEHLQVAVVLQRHVHRERLRKNLPQRHRGDVEVGGDQLERRLRGGLRRWLRRRLQRRLPRRLARRLSRRLGRGLSRRLPSRLGAGLRGRLAAGLPRRLAGRLARRLPRRLTCRLTRRLPRRLGAGLARRLGGGLTRRLTRRLCGWLARRLERRLRGRLGGRLAGRQSSRVGRRLR